MITIDPIHHRIDAFASPLIRNVWRDKYRWGNEESVHDTFSRVVKAIYADDRPEAAGEALECMNQFLFIPGGRIVAGAGTEKRVTLMNCYVNSRLEDSMEGIMQGLTNTALTLQQGGGIGTDFSPLRPENALLTRTHTKASGPLPFMHMWDRASATVRSAGDRRGAMMGTMIDTHPDLIKFIQAKREKGSLEQFNISVLVSDAFMEAVRDDAEWPLFFHVRPYSRDPELEQYDFVDDKGVQQYVYGVYQAREIKELITRNTYEYSEPGILFVDRINDLNNLYYCEDISCTNPCGEQPLPPNACCNLGHINLARCVRHPFTSRAHLDYDLIRRVTAMGIRFLDNVIDITRYPLDDQALEEQNKRRLGLGFTGLADALAQLGVRYGSPGAVALTEDITRTMCLQAYHTSSDLAVERGSFPVFDKDKFLNGSNFASSMLPNDLKDKIASQGLRNSHVMTVAPTGTGSILIGNVSSGCEPVFAHRSERRVLKAHSSAFANEWDTYVDWGYASQLYFHVQGIANSDWQESLLPSHMVSIDDISITDHIVMQAAAQRWVDSSISKTVNVPKDMPYEEFVKVYDLAYSLGCKGCTTYRPSDVRGSILSKPGDKTVADPTPTKLADRPEFLEGRTYKIKWPSASAALYFTINSTPDGRPYEVFLTSKDSKHHDWTTALTVMITAIFRQGGDVSFVARELQQIQSLSDTAFKEGRHHPSLAAYIGYILERHIEGTQSESAEIEVPLAHPVKLISPPALVKGEQCPNCKSLTYIRKEGCKSCQTCGYTTCG